jgi:phosphoadenosine phosphosulfate reductase
MRNAAMKLDYDAWQPFDMAAEERFLAACPPIRILERVLDKFGGRIAAVSSFGTESAVLLAMIAEIDRATPVLFIDPGYLFPETLSYREEIISQLGLTGVRTISPDSGEAAAKDPENSLWADNPDACCALRKVAPLARALAPFDAWINGRKRYHGNLRATLSVFESDGNRVKINPLARMDRNEIDGEFARRSLPRHPLEQKGFASIGCMPCTARAVPGEGVRSGRWRGSGKTECGIHTMSLEKAGAANA